MGNLLLCDERGHDRIFTEAGVQPTESDVALHIVTAVLSLMIMLHQVIIPSSFPIIRISEALMVMRYSSLIAGSLGSPPNQGTLERQGEMISEISHGLVIWDCRRVPWGTWAVVSSLTVHSHGDTVLLPAGPHSAANCD